METSNVAKDSIWQLRGIYKYADDMRSETCSHQKKVKILKETSCLPPSKEKRETIEMVWHKAQAFIAKV